MTGVLALTRLETIRVLRNRRALFFSVLYPAILFSVFASGSSSASATFGGVSTKAYYMAAMAMFGVLSTSIMTTAQKIALERKEGWTKQLKLTTLPGNGYVTAKLLSASVTTLLPIVVVFGIGAASGVHLTALVWIRAAAVIWVTSFAFIALGVAVGYAIPQDSVQMVSMIVYFAMAIAGGLWFPLGNGIIAKIGNALPTFAARDYTQNLIYGGHAKALDLLVIAIWTVAAILFAGYIYQRDAKIES